MRCHHVTNIYRSNRTWSIRTTWIRKEKSMTKLYSRLVMRVSFWFITCSVEKNIYSDSNRNKARKRDWQPKKNLSQVYPESFEEYFEYVDCWGWSSVMASYLVGGCPLRWTMYGIWRKYEFFELFEINKQTFFNFTDRIERAYQKVSFYWIRHRPIILERLFQTVFSIQIRTITQLTQPMFFKRCTSW